MEPKPPPLAGVLLLGASLVALGGLLYWWTTAQPATAEAATVDLLIRGPDGGFVFNASQMDLPPSQATVLGALVRGAQLGNFTVDVTYGFYGQAFVTSIHGVKNEGSCGWVWVRNGVLGDRAADRQPVSSGDEVLWRWGCGT